MENTQKHKTRKDKQVKQNGNNEIRETERHVENE